MLEDKLMEKAEIFKTFNAIHIGWSGPVVLLNDGTFRGGLNSPDGQWKTEGDVLTLAWYHWPDSVLKSNGIGSYISMNDSGDLTLHDKSVYEDDLHLGGNIPGGDPLTFYPNLWKWMIELFSIGSVLDIGCAEGHAQDEFRKLGVHTVGIEGHKLNAKETTNKGLTCILHDFTKGILQLDKDFDLGWCCEFVEHVEEQNCDNILATFKKCRIIAMTHAVPGQGGYHHVNCQNPEYWIEKMSGSGFTLLAQETEDSRKFYPNTYWEHTGLIFESNK